MQFWLALLITSTLFITTIAVIKFAAITSSSVDRVRQSFFRYGIPKIIPLCIIRRPVEGFLGNRGFISETQSYFKPCFVVKISNVCNVQNTPQEKSEALSCISNLGIIGSSLSAIHN